MRGGQRFLASPPRGPAFRGRLVMRGRDARSQDTCSSVIAPATPVVICSATMQHQGARALREPRPPRWVWDARVTVPVPRRERGPARTPAEKATAARRTFLVAIPENVRCSPIRGFARAIASPTGLLSSAASPPTRCARQRLGAPMGTPAPACSIADATPSVPARGRTTSARSPVRSVQTRPLSMAILVERTRSGRAALASQNPAVDATASREKTPPGTAVPRGSWSPGSRATVTPRGTLVSAEARGCVAASMECGATAPSEPFLTAERVTTPWRPPRVPQVHHPTPGTLRSPQGHRLQQESLPQHDDVAFRGHPGSLRLAPGRFRSLAGRFWTGP